MSSPTRLTHQERFLESQRRGVKEAIARRSVLKLAEVQAEVQAKARKAAEAYSNRGGADPGGLKKAAARWKEAKRVSRLVDPAQQRDEKGRLIAKRAARLAKEKAFYARERAANEATYRKIISAPTPPPLPAPKQLSSWKGPPIPTIAEVRKSARRPERIVSRGFSGPGSTIMSGFSNKGRPMSLQMGEGGWDEEGFFGIGALAGSLAGKAGSWALKKFGGGGQGPGPNLQQTPPNVPYRGSRPGMDWADLAPGGSTRMTEPSGAGYVLNKSGYFLKSGEYVEPGSRWVKRRRRNSLNPKALSRAIGRIVGAKKASKAIGRISVRKKC